MMRASNSKTLSVVLLAFVAGLFVVLGASLLGRPEHHGANLEPRCGIASTDAPDDGMVFVQGGTLRMGEGGIYAEERPVVTVQVEDFWISSHDVTNRQFERFVRTTGYVTVAERDNPPTMGSSVTDPSSIPGGAVFRQPVRLASLSAARWWDFIGSANWRHPEGSQSGIDERLSHPVVQVAFADAQAFATWAGLDLPTEAEWEYAARGVRSSDRFPWGNELNPGQRQMANTWQGEFPFYNSRADGFEGTSPVGCFSANRLGLYDMVGNVWQWTKDWYFPDHLHNVQASVSIESHAGSVMSYDPDNPRVPSRVIKGGSYLCAVNFCSRFRPAARQPHQAELGTDHLGFRIVGRVAPTSQLSKPPARE